MPRKMARSDPRPSVRVTRGAGSGQHLASVLQEAGKTRTLMPVWDSSGESRFNRYRQPPVCEKRTEVGRNSFPQAEKARFTTFFSLEKSMTSEIWK